MRSVLVTAALVAISALAACSGDDGTADLGSEKATEMCRQWDTVDAELAAETLGARDAIAALAALLPEEYKRDAALRYYPGAGDPGPDADASKAIEAGDRLDSYRQEVCDNRLTSFSFGEFFVAVDAGFAFERVDRATPEPLVALSEGDECFTDPSWVEGGAPFDRGESRSAVPSGAQRGHVNVMQQCDLPSGDS